MLLQIAFIYPFSLVMWLIKDLYCVFSLFSLFVMDQTLKTMGTVSHIEYFVSHMMWIRVNPTVSFSPATSLRLPPMLLLVKKERGPEKTLLHPVLPLLPTPVDSEPTTDFLTSWSIGTTEVKPFLYLGAKMGFSFQRPHSALQQTSDPSELFAVRSVCQVEAGSKNNTLLLEESSERQPGPMFDQLSIFVHKSRFFFSPPSLASLLFFSFASFPLL